MLILQPEETFQLSIALIENKIKYNREILYKL